MKNMIFGHFRKLLIIYISIGSVFRAKRARSSPPVKSGMNPAVFLSEKRTSSKPIAWRKFVEYTLCDLFLEVHDNDRHQNEEYTQKTDYSKSFMISKYSNDSCNNCFD